MAGADPARRHRRIFRDPPLQGHPYSVQRALDSLGISTEIIEWWEPEGSGQPGTMKVLALVNQNIIGGEGLINAEMLRLATRAIEGAKRGSIHFDLELGIALTEALALAAGVGPGVGLSDTSPESLPVVPDPAGGSIELALGGHSLTLADHAATIAPYLPDSASGQIRLAGIAHRTSSITNSLESPDMALKLQFTADGLAECISAKEQGLRAEITHMAFGSTAFTPNKNTRPLPGQQEKIEITDYQDGGQDLRMAGIFDGNLNTPSATSASTCKRHTAGRLLGTQRMIGYCTPAVRVVQWFTLNIEALPSESVTVTVGVENLNLILDAELAIGRPLSCVKAPPSSKMLTGTCS